MANSETNTGAQDDPFARIERRHDQLLEQLDELNDRIEAALAQLAPPSAGACEAA